MGFPIDSYTLVSALLGDDELSLARKDASDLARQFNLFGFVLYDPETNIDFGETVERRFDMLDELTGSKFLFFALLPSREAQASHHNRPKHFHMVRELLRGSHGKPPLLVSPVGVTRDAKRNLGTVLSHLELATTDLPCIGITPSLTSESAVFLPATAQTLVPQLQGLAAIAHTARDLSREALVGEIIDMRLDRAGPPLDSPPEVHFACALRNATCLLEDPSHYASLGRPVMSRIDSLLAELARQWDTLRRTTDDVSGLGLLAERWLSALAAKERGSNANHDLFVGSRDWVDSQTWDSLCSSLDVRHLFEREDRDCSPVVASIGKAFEREMNLVPLQWARSELGIPMPEYFALYCDNREALVRTANGRTVDLNAKGRTRQHRFLELGPGCHVLRALSKRPLADCWDEPDYGRFLCDWDRLRELRNAASHGEAKVSQNDMREAEQLAAGFFGSESYTQQMLGELKRRLAPGQPQPVKGARS